MSTIQELPAGIQEIDLVRVLNDRIRQINLALGGGTSATDTGASIGYGTRAQRLGQPARNFADASLWVETDRLVTYQIQSRVWTYASGIYKATLASAPTGLGSADTGFLWSVSDYAHLLRWTGSGWEFVDAQGGYVEWRVVVPDGNGWQLCDGSSTSYLHVSGASVSATSYTTLNMTGNPLYLKMGAAYGGAINAAVVPTTSAPSSPYVAVGTGSANAASLTHTHTITLPGDPVPNAVGLPYFRR